MFSNITKSISLLFTNLLIILFLPTFVSAQIKLALNWKAEPQFGGFYAASLDGIFKKNGLAVTVLEGGSGTPTLQMLLAGSAEYAVVSGDEIVISHSRGNNEIVALFAVYQTNPQAILTHAEKKYSQLSDVFKDSKSTLLLQSGLPYAQYLTKKYGPLKVKTAPYAGGISAFQADANLSQQCFFTSEPLLAEKSKIKIKTFLVADSGYNPYTTVLVTKRERLTKNKDEVVKIVNSVRAGWENYLKEPSKYHKDLNKINPGMDVESMDKSAEAQKPLIAIPSIQVGSMDLTRWQTLIDQLADLKVISKKPEALSIFEKVGDK